MPIERYAKDTPILWMSESGASLPDVKKSSSTEAGSGFALPDVTRFRAPETVDRFTSSYPNEKFDLVLLAEERFREEKYGHKRREFRTGITSDDSMVLTSFKEMLQKEGAVNYMALANSAFYNWLANAKTKEAQEACLLFHQRAFMQLAPTIFSSSEWDNAIGEAVRVEEKNRFGT